MNPVPASHSAPHPFLALGLAAVGVGVLPGIADAAVPAAPTAPPIRFEKRVLTDRYYCDGIAAGDLDRDGHPDVVAGPFIHMGPDFTRRIEFYPALAFPTEPSPTDSMFSHVHDFDGDGWPDILVLGRVHLHQAFWYRNPLGGTRSGGAWPRHFAFHRVQGENPPFADADRDGQPELVAHWQNRWGLIQPSRNEPTKPWSFAPITAPGEWHHFYHGEGLGDLDGDGRPDLLLNEGWYQQPVHPAGEWTRHEYRFAAKGGAQMFAYDVDGDGDQDVLTALDAHGWGLAWFENVRNGGVTTFRPHPIMGSRDEEAVYGVAFSQPHALALADLDGDGLSDLIAGKRRWAHGPKGDIEPGAAPVLYWFRLERPPQGPPRFTPHLIDDASGVGVQIAVADLDRDGRPDLMSASKLGAFVFFNRKPEIPARPVP